jgi:hypothetical protein
MAELLDAAMLTKLADLHTCFPARIEAYDYTTQRASVKPLLNRKLRDGRIESLPVISNVPVWMPRSGGASITLPVSPGDTCFVACTERSIDEWLQRGGVQTPADPRKHSLFDAVAFVGLIPFNVGTDAENAQDVLIQYAGSKVRLKPGAAVEIEAATVKIISPETEMTGNLTVAGLTTTAGFVSQGTIGGGATITGNVDITSGTVTVAGGDVVADGISLKTHTHSGVQAGGDNTGGPV